VDLGKFQSLLGQALQQISKTIIVRFHAEVEYRAEKLLASRSGEYERSVLDVRPTVWNRLHLSWMGFMGTTGSIYALHSLFRRLLRGHISPKKVDAGCVHRFSAGSESAALHGLAVVMFGLCGYVGPARIRGVSLILLLNGKGASI
jgi:hypothetical protein